MRIPKDRLAFDIDGVVADIITTFLEMARDRYGQDHLCYEHLTAYVLDECLDLEPEIIDSLLRELIDRPHELPVEPLPYAGAGLNPPGSRDPAPIHYRPGPSLAY